MAWVPIEESTKPWTFGENGGYAEGSVTLINSVVTAEFGGRDWALDAANGSATAANLYRITVLNYTTQASSESSRAEFLWYDEDVNELVQQNEASNEDDTFLPAQFEIQVGDGGPVYFWQAGAKREAAPTDYPETFQFLIEVWEESPPEPVTYKFSEPTKAHELDRGWSFDGQYIPHFLELNWFFGEDPVTYKSVNKVRIHGLVKGTVNLEVSMSGMQGDVATDYIPDYTDPEYLDFPFTPIHVQSDFITATNYVDYSDRGLALLMKFEGRNQNITLPEPSHVIQVLALQSSPQGNGKTAN